ncbi:Dipeptidyl aminopeptidase/acylaminoacyl peptidase [Colwellia chukchiensis]|uniref:Dipeptidyl aminopeptidase/acylaminoacyl peptidase n=1 Tax=Colwellia chukchiensis TaxID=641665 RepID=A0A1H7PFD1_9GAMM|nr:DPP IV N-terminal domain-containing protein [Colwellia chukchiensis]SEL34134.1 Dipeptidyl aminopeptidase/acylaminoacyl peptidase [Colwellia chukchiensis]
MVFKLKHLSSLLVFTCLTSLSAYAESLSVDKYQQAERQLSKHTEKLVFSTTEHPQWTDNNLLTYQSHTAQGKQFFIVDPVSKAKNLAFDHEKLAHALTQATGKDTRADQLPFERFNLRDKNSITLKITDKTYQCNIENFSCEALESTVKAGESLAPNGKLAVYIKDHNLWLRDLTTNSHKQLTTDGVQDYGYATNNAGWIRDTKPVVKWSPDSSKLTTFKHDSRRVGEMAIVSTTVGHPEIDVWKYPLPGDEHIFTIKRVVIDIEQAKVLVLDMPADAHRSTITDHVAGRDGALLDIDWASDSSHFAFVSSTRDHKTATLKIADANTGKVRTVLSESSDSFFESGVNGISWQYLDQSEEFIWFSQRSNWGHLYLVDATNGKIKNPITQGDWTVLELLHVNQDTGKLIFTGAGKEGGDPYFQYLYSINKNGAGLTLLTPEQQHHRVTLSKNAEFFLDRVSAPNQPEVSFVRSTNRKSGFMIEQMDISQLSATGWQPPNPFVVKDRNNQHDIYGLLYKPSDFDASKSYPVVNYLYPGPQVGSIRGRHFRSARGDNQAIAELGFIVIEIDALGTPGRSKSFHDFYYQNMGDSGIPDQVAAIKQLAQKHSWIDSSRVGIWGHSGGGFASTRALLTYPDFYSVAVSQAGNHDNRNYADEWGEKYHGALVSQADGSTNYDSQANQLIAKNLQGKLLIAHGTTDTNVTPYNSLVVVEALIAANKDFDMLMLPNRGHGFAREPYMMRKRWDYFVQHLLQLTPPKEFNFAK